ncbi:MAG: hypothetical protein IKL84_07705 [Clostridia bacterium]|nr:hypothetical protein [Clostridia bacterium]
MNQISTGTEKNKWTKLDNAAKLFAASTSRSETHVFRFSCELDAPVNPELLQTSLNETAQCFPIFNYALRRGVFWYYLEPARVSPTVEEERKPICSALYRPRAKTLLYAVSYFGATVNFEVYHVLSDGTGAMHFLRTLIMKYLALAYQISEESLGYETAHSSMNLDSFSHYAQRTPVNRLRLPRAYQLRGPRLSDSRTGLIRGTMDTQTICRTAKDTGATLTVYLTAALIEAIGEGMSLRARRRPVMLNIPVNLRNYFASDSVRNFFTMIRVGYDFSARSGEFSDILSVVRNTFSEELTRDKLAERFRGYTAFEDNPFARITPLHLKDLIMRIIYAMSCRAYTAVLSNVGIVEMPPAFASHIRSFHVCNATHKLQLCVCSFNGRLSISATSPFTETDVQRRFFRRLAALDPELIIETNLLDGDV